MLTYICQYLRDKLQVKIKTAKRFCPEYFFGVKEQA